MLSICEYPLGIRSKATFVLYQANCALVCLAVASVIAIRHLARLSRTMSRRDRFQYLVVGWRW